MLYYALQRTHDECRRSSRLPHRTCAKHLFLVSGGLSRRARGALRCASCVGCEIQDLKIASVHVGGCGPRQFSESWYPDAPMSATLLFENTMESLDTAAKLSRQLPTKARKRHWRSINENSAVNENGRKNPQAKTEERLYARKKRSQSSADLACQRKKLK